MGFTEIITAVFLIAALLLLILLYGRISSLGRTVDMTENAIKEARADVRDIKDDLLKSLGIFGQMMDRNQKEAAYAQDKRLGELENKFHHMALENEQKLENIRETVSRRLKDLTEDNDRRLEQIRQTVDDKLQRTLEERIGESFKAVGERLEQVYRGLGEMRSLASGVGDLKKVLSNVKTRGILGEIQLGAILEQILSPEQYDENVRTKSTGNEKVEYAVKLPGDNDRCVYLPIDAKFPGDAYSRLADAYDTGDKEKIEAAGKNLERVIKSEAKDIRDKYVEPPSTTDFAIMFLPFEGLYAEIVRRGLVEDLQRAYRISVAGPTTMAALLNSLQMGFKTLAIQKHSGEVWEILGAVKNEFDKFEDVLISAQNRINQANSDLDKLVGTRSRMIRSKLRRVTTLTDEKSGAILDSDGEK